MGGGGGGGDNEDGGGGVVEDGVEDIHRGEFGIDGNADDGGDQSYMMMVIVLAMANVALIRRRATRTRGAVPHTSCCSRRSEAHRRVPTVVCCNLATPLWLGCRHRHGTSCYLYAAPTT